MLLEVKMQSVSLVLHEADPLAMAVVMKESHLFDIA